MTGRAHQTPKLPEYVKSSPARDLDSSDLPPCRRKRTSYNRMQLLELEREFQTKKYLTAKERLRTAARLQLDELQVKVWFQNRRQRWKRSNTGSGIKHLSSNLNVPIPMYAKSLEY